MIVPTLARLLIREHIYRPIQGKVLTLGRQTIAMSYEQTIAVLSQEGYTPSEQALRQVASTNDMITRVGKGTNFITDEAFFGLLGIKELLVLDVSSYEGAQIVHNLNEPIPESLCGQFDFLIDGGTFDHLFDIRVAFENVVKLLKVGGRVFQWNAASNFTGVAYLSFGPDLFYDYFILNQFTDCKVYVVEVDDISQSELWDFYEYEGAAKYDHFRSERIQMVVVLAEKGPHSIYHRYPIQAQYRDQLSLKSYESGKENAQKGDRELFVREITLSLNESARDARGLGARIMSIKRRTPTCLKRKIPLKLKKLVHALLQDETVRVKKIEGYRYVGRL